MSEMTAKAMGAVPRVGDVWRSVSTGNRWQVSRVALPYVTVEALDGGRFGDAFYGFHVSAFTDGTLERV